MSRLSTRHKVFCSLFKLWNDKVLYAEGLHPQQKCTFKIFVCGEAFCGVTQAETERVRIQILICVLFIFMNMRSSTFYSNKSYFSPLYSSQTSKQCVSDRFEMLILVGRAKKVWKKEEKTLFLDRSVQFAKSIWHQKIFVFFNRFFKKRNPLKEQRFQKCFWVFFIVLSRAVTRETLFFKKLFLLFAWVYPL